MANDRIFLKCQECGEQHLMMKYYPSRTQFYDADKTAAWIHDHLLICGCADMFIERFPFVWLSESTVDSEGEL